MSPALGVIPARIGSTRLPRKPLQPLLGKPLILWVWERARRMDVLDRLVVATDSSEIARVCRRAGAEVARTSPEHATGSDRVWEVARASDALYDVVVNVQGDEPLIEPECVAAAVGMVEAGFDAGTCAAPIDDPTELDDPSVVKVVRTASGRALYFSRAEIPHRRPGTEAGRARPRLRHVGVYAYRRRALERWVGLGPSALEEEEGLEQLRALEHGMRIGVAVVASAAVGVDTPADLRRVERRLRARREREPSKRNQEE